MAKTMKLADLKPDKRNANRGTERGRKAILQSLKDLGAGRSILIDKHGRIIAGNKTAENAAAAGLKDLVVVQTDGTKLVAVQRTDLDLEADPRAKGLAIADNRAAELSLDWDPGVLKEFSSEIDLSPYFTAQDLEAILPTNNALLTDEDEAPPVPATPETKPGDLYELGDHRLLCGDATKEDDVARVMGAEKAGMVWTDPPYNVAYQTKLSRDEAVARNRRKDGLELANDSMSAEAFDAFLQASLSLALAYSSSGSSVYVCHADANGEAFRRAFRVSSWDLKQCLIWKKDVFVMGCQDYQWSHESILYGWKKGKAHSWYADRSQTTVLEFARPRRSEEHPTMKPVALIEYCLRNSSEAQAIVLDPFGGSGSTLMACEKTGRRCRMLELDPRYCDVIVKRWENATGRKAVKHGAA